MCQIFAEMSSWLVYIGTNSYLTSIGTSDAKLCTTCWWSENRKLLGPERIKSDILLHNTKNLLKLCLKLCLLYIEYIWLSGHGHRDGNKLCRGAGKLNHFSNLVSEIEFAKIC